MYLSDNEAKTKILEIGKSMSAARFVTANDGNITIRCSKDAVWATPTGVNKGEMKEEMLIKVRIEDGKIIEGTWRATSELEMHLAAYRTDDEIVSTAHAHPLNLSVLACAGIELDLPTTPAACLISGRIPVIPYKGAGTKELAESIIPYVKKFHVVNLGNHGPIAWGKSPNEAWYRLENAESAAAIALELVKIGKMRPLTRGQVKALCGDYHVGISDEAMVRTYNEELNQEPSISFTEYFKKELGL